MEEKNKRVLIVEDDKSTMDALSVKFEQFGFIIDKAVDGIECLAAIEKNKPDIVLMDLIMPKKGVLDVLKDLKGDAETKDIPVVIVSNLSEDKVVKETKDLGAADYLVKAENSIFEIADKALKHIK